MQGVMFRPMGDNCHGFKILCRRSISLLTVTVNKKNELSFQQIVFGAIFSAIIFLIFLWHIFHGIL